ncbi:hypothetical protein FB45DRAFT_1064146 [Roridomyces roridus]|uniref:Transmembrane protein n=1 Tax=Roridomyces roridus TaxID=1738132 RepID=A0AAD7BB22_9AGAR|nr:hypothetical protein FB45DRAFT_1064146 [Roridomyces roridus]
MASASASPQCNPGSPSCGLQTTTLYLYGFLAGVLVLSTLGIALVTRTRFFTRRREREMHRLMAAARLARGEDEVKSKPQIFDAHLGPAPASAAEAHDWEAIVPLSLAYTSLPESATKEKPASPPAQSISTMSVSPLSQIHPSPFFPRWRAGRRRREFYVPQQTTAENQVPSPEAETAPFQGRACAGYLIAMPVEPNHSRPELALPQVELGVTEMPVPQMVVDGSVSVGGRGLGEETV